MTVRVTREAEPQIELYGAFSGQLAGNGKRELTFTPTENYLIMVVKNTLSKVQLEEGAFKTSYIPTTTAAKTRSADIASIDVDQFGYNKKAGSVVVDYTEFHNYTASPYPRVLALTNGYSPREGLEILSFNSIGNVAGYVGGSSIFSFVGATSTKTAFSASENNFSASFGGGAALTDTAGAMPSATLLELGKYSSLAFLNGHIKSIQYYPRRLSNAQLQELTS